VRRDLIDCHHPAWAATAGRAFTLYQANRSLVLIKRIVGEVVVEFRRLLDVQEALEQAQRDGADESVCTDARWRIRRTFGRLERCREELSDVGVELKDWVRGTVHFPADVDGEPVTLCWRHGERSVSHWHPDGASCAMRRPLRELASTYAPRLDPTHQAVISSRRR
jgi:hypothetical protein